MLDGLMMDYPLTLTHFLMRAQALFPRAEVVSRLPDRSLHRCTYADVVRRASRLAGALRRLGVGPGDRVATLCWNHHAHLEAYLGVPAMGAVVHTLNLRLHPSELGYIAAHAEDQVLIVDQSLWPLFEKFRPQVTSLEHVLVVPDGGATPSGALDYEAALAAEPAVFDFPRLDENAAAMLCYTSGTTGKPKGVLYSHRSTVLHALVCAMRDTLGAGQDDTLLPVVPMFHAAAWGLPYAAAATGAKLVLPGPHLDPTSLLELMAGEKVTLAAGVPTVWLGILAALDQAPGRWDLRSVRSMVIGGAAAPAAMIDGFKRRHGLEVTHAWGMTETNPMGTLAKVKRHLAGADDAALLKVKSSQGFPVAFVEQRHVSDDGRVLPWDGETMGELEVRGPWVARGYYGGEHLAGAFAKFWIPEAFLVVKQIPRTSTGKFLKSKLRQEYGELLMKPAPTA